MAKLGERDLVCAEVLVGKGKSIRSVARDLGVDESTLRYRLQRRAAGVADGRKGKPEACDEVAHVIEGWIERQPWDSTDGRNRPESIKVLYTRQAFTRLHRSYRPGPSLNSITCWRRHE